MLEILLIAANEQNNHLHLSVDSICKSEGHSSNMAVSYKQNKKSELFEDGDSDYLKTIFF